MNLASLAIRFRRLRSMTVKELQQFFRDRILLAFMAYTFTVAIFLSGSGVNMELSDAITVVHDNDHSRASRDLLYRFRDPHFQLDGEVDHAKEGTRMLDEGRAMIVLDVPPRFDELLMSGEPTSLQMQVDSSNSTLALLANTYGTQIVSRYSLEVAMAREGLDPDVLERVPIIEDRHRVWFNPNQQDAWFVTITQMLNMTTLFGIMLPATALAREKERGTVEQLLVTPLNAFEVLAPKIISMTVIILAGAALALFGVLEWHFGVPIKGSLLLFFGVTAIYVFATAGIGILIATIARNLAQVGMLTALIIFPMVFLSGAWTPPEAMSAPMRMFVKISPLHHYLNASNGILLKGAGIGVLWDSILAILGLGVVLFCLGVWRFRRQFG